MHQRALHQRVVLLLLTSLTTAQVSNACPIDNSQKSSGHRIDAIIEMHRAYSQAPASRADFLPCPAWAACTLSSCTTYAQTQFVGTRRQAKVPGSLQRTGGPRVLVGRVCRRLWLGHCWSFSRSSHICQVVPLLVSTKAEHHQQLEEQKQHSFVLSPILMTQLSGHM